MGHIPDRVLDGWDTFQTACWMAEAHSKLIFGWTGHIPDRVLDEWGTSRQSFGWMGHIPGIVLDGWDTVLDGWGIFQIADRV